jgi:hypothetical protein
MWVFTKDGFFSVVQKPAQKKTDMITIRARARKDLITFLKKSGLPADQLILGGGSDYEYRVEVSKSIWARYLTNEIDNLDYSNFKHEVEAVDSERAKIYLRVWGDILAVAAKRLHLKQKSNEQFDFGPNYGSGSGYFDDGGIWRSASLPTNKKIKKRRKLDR